MLRNHERYIIANTDKNLGPCAIEIERYKRDALSHLANEEVYERLSEDRALFECTRVANEILAWVERARERKAIDKHSATYLRKHTKLNSSDPFSYFYLTYKVHKPKLSTRPI